MIPKSLFPFYENFVLLVLVGFVKNGKEEKKGQKEGYFSPVFLRTCGNILLCETKKELDILS